jgi:hypothetical protein
VPIKLLVVKGKPLNLTNTLANYWNSKLENNSYQHCNQNYKVSNKCICGTVETNYMCQKNMLLPAHEHLEYNDHGKLFILDCNGVPILPFNAPVDDTSKNDLSLMKNKNTYINKNIYVKNLYKNKNKN